MEDTPKKRGYEKGHPKAGGRKKGTPNKTTAEKRALTDRLVGYCMERIFNEKEQLELREVIALARDYMPYYQGKMENVPYRDEASDENSENKKTQVEKVTLTIK